MVSGPSGGLSGSQPPSQAATAYAEAVPAALQTLMESYGAVLLGDPVRLRGLLNDEVPQARRETSLLLLALEERVPQDLLRVHSGEDPAAWSRRLVRRLVDERALSPQAAQWAVRAWMQALGLGSVSQDMASMDPPERPAGVQMPPSPSATHSPQTPVGSLGLASQASLPASVLPDSLSPRAWFRRSLPAKSPVPEPMPDLAGALAPAPVDGPGPAMSEPDKAERAAPRLSGLGRRWAAAAGFLALTAAAVAGWWFGTSHMAISNVEIGGPFVGNGKPVPVFIDVDLRRAEPQQVAVRLVEGEGAWAPKAWQADLVPVGQQPGRFAAGTLQVQTSRPLSATFEYTLIARNGDRSAPFRRTVSVVPPLVITKVDLPRWVPLGRDIEFGVHFQKSSAAVVRLERRVVNSSLPWADGNGSQELSPAPSDKSVKGRLLPFAKPAQATLEFTLVDAAGVRSDPVRVVVNAGTPPAPPGTGPGTVIAMRTLGTGAGASAGASGGNRFGLPSFRELTGTVVDSIVGPFRKGGSARQPPSGAAPDDTAGSRAPGPAAHATTVAVETTVRFDEGSTRVITTQGTPGWQVGSRVSWNGSRMTVLK